jgi:hypothetical protein
MDLDSIVTGAKATVAVASGALSLYILADWVRSGMSLRRERRRLQNYLSNLPKKPVQQLSETGEKLEWKPFYDALTGKPIPGAYHADPSPLYPWMNKVALN